MEQTRRSEPFGTAVAPLLAVGGFRLWRTLMTITDVDGSAPWPDHLIAETKVRQEPW